MTSVLVLSLWTRRGAWCLVFKEGADGGLGDGCLRWLLSRGFRREDQVLEKEFWVLVLKADAGMGSGVKDLPGVSLISGLPLLEQLTRKEMAPGCVGEEEVSSEFGRVTQERAGAEEGVVVLSPKKRRQEKRDKVAT